MAISKNIVWIASYPKSGNTWFRLFLSNILSEDDHSQSINKINISNIASNRALFDSISGISASDIGYDQIDCLRPPVFRQLASDSNNPVFLKVHDAWTLNSDGNPIFPPDATKAVIYIIRHPLDVAVSFSYHQSDSISRILEIMNDNSYSMCSKPGILFNQLRQKLLSWSSHVKSWTIDSGLNILVLKYEDMKLNPYITFSNALDFLSISYKREELINAIENSSFNNLSFQEQKTGFKEKPINAQVFFRKGIIEDWKNHIDINTAQAFLDNNSKIFERYYPEF